jgi:TRAP-type C4-dicarboxylate transport system permease large subunit
MPYLGVLLLDLLLITYFQDIILVIPRTFGG